MFILCGTSIENNKEPVQVSGSWLRNPATGELMVSLSATPRSTLTGSFNSPASLPEPSTPTPPPVCEPLASGLFGFIQLPITLQNEGMFVYWNQQVANSRPIGLGSVVQASRRLFSEPLNRLWISRCQRSSYHDTSSSTPHFDEKWGFAITAKRNKSLNYIVEAFGC